MLRLEMDITGFGRRRDQEKTRKFVERTLRSALHDGRLVVRIAHVERVEL